MNELADLSYALDTFYFLICGVLVMWMAAGFSMLEAGLVRSKTPQRSLPKHRAICDRLHHVPAGGLLHHVLQQCWRLYLIWVS